MKILIILAHPEAQSMNSAMFRTAIETLEAARHQVKTSDLYSTTFNPVSGRHNFTTVLDAAYFKQQLEEMHATKYGGFAPEINSEQQKVESFFTRRLRSANEGLGRAKPPVPITDLVMADAFVPLFSSWLGLPEPTVSASAAGRINCTSP